MNTINRPKVTIINKFYPPNSGVTGEFANELANYLSIEYDFDVKIVHTDSSYGKNIIEKQVLGTSHVVKSVDIGKGTFRRLLSALCEGFKLVWKARKINQGEPVIVLTDPPFVTFFAGLLFKKIDWVYWAMDLYPEAYVSAGIIKSKNVFYKTFESIVYNNFPKHIISLGENQAAYLLDKYQKNIATTVLPASLKQTPQKHIENPNWYDAHKTHICYCGNLGRAHSPNFIIELVKKLDPDKFTFILSSFGPKSHMVKEAIKDFPCVHIIPKLDIEEMKFIDIHSVSLLHEWTHICVPSKAFTALNTNGAVLFYGEPESDSWEAVKKVGWLINPYKDLVSEIETFVNNFTLKDLELRKANTKISAQSIEADKAFSFKQIAQAMKIYYYSKHPSIETVIKKTQVQQPNLVRDR